MVLGLLVYQSLVETASLMAYMKTRLKMGEGLLSPGLPPLPPLLSHAGCLSHVDAFDPALPRPLIISDFGLVLL